MRNYIRAELYRSFNRAYFWGMTAFFAIGSLLYNGLALYMGNMWEASINFESILQAGSNLLSIPPYLIIMFVDMITAEEHKNNTLKNVIAGGLSRDKAFIGKIIAEVILAFISAGIILAVYLGSGFLMFGLGSPLNMGAVADFFIRFVVAIPIWISAIAACTMVGIIIKNNTVFAFVYAFGLSFGQIMLNLLAMLVGGIFTKIYHYSPITQLNILSGNNMITQELILSCIGVGVLYTLIFTGLGLVYMRHKTIQ